jgi:NTE family protein
MPWRKTIAVWLLILTAPAVALAQQGPARPRIGLALGGGSARGLAHIGLLQWFEEHRIPIDVIAGTSMGGLVGGSYATGLSPDEIRTVLETADWTLIFQGESPFADKNFRRKQDDRAFPSKLHFGLKGGLRLPSGLNEGQQVDLLLDAITLQYSEVASFDDLPTPFRCVASDLVSAQPVVLKDGSLSLAMRATMSLPGVFIPVRVGNHVFVDGGIFDNIPADVARAMGADIVIAVSVGGSDVAGQATPASSYSIFSVLGQMVDAMMSGNTRRGLVAADLVIRPAVDDVGSMDFRATKEIAALGYQAAETHSAELLKYALDEPAYAAFRAAREARRRRDAIVPRAIEVEGVPPVSQEMIRARLAPHLNVPVDVAALARDITRLGGSDRYETIGYRIVAGPDGQVLRLNVQPKPYGPPFLNVGIDLTNTSGTNLQLGLGSRFTAFDVAGYGSEARVDVHVGSGFLFGGELYRPVGRSRWFVAPGANIRQTETELFVEDTAIANYRLTRSSVELDFGYSTGERSEVRLGYEAANVQASVLTGPRLLPELDGREQVARLQATFDGQDSPTIPSRGTYARGRASYFFNTADLHGEPLPSAPPFDEVFTTADFAVTWFKTVRPRTRVLAAAVGGTAFGASPLPPNSYALGGPFRLGAYNEGQLRTPDFLVGSGGLAREFARLPDVLGGGVFGLVWLESGSAFDGAGLRTNVSAAFVIETLLGPMFLGTSVGFDGRYRLYVGMGPLFGRGAR